MLGVGISTNQGLSWQTTTGFITWEMADVTFHPTQSNTLWIGSMSGPYKSIDGGRTWQSKRNGMPALLNYDYSCPIEKILFNPNNVNELLAFGGSNRGWNGTSAGNQGSDPTRWGAVWKSTDGGESWSFLSQVGIQTGIGITGVCYAGSNHQQIWAAVHGQGIFKSMNGGTSWTPMNNGITGLNVWTVVSHPSDAAIAYAAVGRYQDINGNWKAGGIFKTIDGGNNWSKLAGGLQNNDDVEVLTASYKALSISPTEPNTLYTSNLSYWPTGCFKTTDGGTTWTSVMTGTNTPPRCRGFNAGIGMTIAKVSPTNAQHVLYVNSETLFQSTNGGTTWEDITNTYIANDQTKGRGYSGWVSTNFEFNPFQSNQAVFQAMDNGKYWKSSDNLQTWKGLGSGMNDYGGGWDVCFAGTNGNIQYMTAGQHGHFEGVYKTTDGGNNWSRFNYQSFPGVSEWGGEPKGVHCLPNDPNNVWVVAQDKLYYSSTGGSSWSVLLNASGMSFIAAESATPSTFYVTTAAGLYKTTDGSTFQLMSGSPTNLSHIDISGTNIYVTSWRSATSGLFKFNGTTWTRLRSDYLIHGVAVHPTISGLLAISFDQHPFTDISGTSGVDFSTNDGLTWTNHPTGLGMLRGEVLRFNPAISGELIFGTGGGGFYISNVNSIQGLGLLPKPAVLQVGASSILSIQNGVLQSTLPQTEEIIVYNSTGIELYRSLNPSVQLMENTTAFIIVHIRSTEGLYITKLVVE